MEVTVELVDEITREFDIEPGTTYGELLADFDVSPHEVSVLVNGRPVPEDQPVEAEHIRVVRLIKGG